MGLFSLPMPLLSWVFFPVLVGDSSVNTRVLVVAAIVLASFTFPRTAHAQGVLSRGLWIDRAELMSLPMSGSAWSNLNNAAQASCGSVNLSDQEDTANVCVMAKALVFARTGNTSMRTAVVSAITSVVNSGTYQGRALALGRELAAYPIAADLISLRTFNPSLDTRFRQKIRELLTTSTNEGPRNLIDCHERRPNNWGTHCGASRVAVAAYLGDTAQLSRAAQVFRGWLGDRGSYAGFSYGDLDWQCNPSAPVGINPMGCRIGSAPVGGVLPDDQRRAGSYRWPPTQENYVFEALQGAMVEAVILHRAGYDTFNWQNQALVRAFKWLQNEADYLAEGDDTWLPHLVNYFYGRGTLPAQSTSRPGKNVGWTDWTHSGQGTSSGSGDGGSGSGDGSGGSTPPPSGAGTYAAIADAYVRGGTSGSTNFGTSSDLESKDSNSTSSEYHRHTFLRFRIAAGAVSTATLRVYVSALPNGTPAPLCVHSVTSDSWSETGITWNNKPAAGGAMSCKSVSAPGWVTWDVTSFVRSQASYEADNVVSLMLRESTQSNKMVRLDSREGSNKPVLVVN
jgi:hypothetical protein